MCEREVGGSWPEVDYFEDFEDDLLPDLPPCPPVVVVVVPACPGYYEPLQ